MFRYNTDRFSRHFKYGSMRPEEGFDPAKVAGVVLHLDASDFSTMFTNSGATNPAGIGDPVHVWVDRVNGEQISAPLGTNRPTLAEPIADYPGLEGNGVDSYMISDNGVFGVFDAGITAFVVHRSNTRNNSDLMALGSAILGTGNATLEVFQVDTGSGLGDRRVTTNRASTLAVIGDGVTLPGTPPEGMVFEFHASGASTGETVVDGVVIDNTKAGVGSLLPAATGDYLHLMRGVFSQYLDGTIHEIVMADENLSSGDRVLIRDHLLEKWSGIIGV